MKHTIQNEIEYLVAQAQAETDMARSLLDQARIDNDYWEEKAAAKIVAFLESEEKMLSLYADIKSYHPRLAISIEERKPYLLHLLAEAKENFDTQANQQ